MNHITKLPAEKLGYDFVDKAYIPDGKDEYYIRNEQNRTVFGEEKKYRHLKAREIETLVQNNNTSDDWNKIWVTEAFDPDLVIGCHFFGLVRIGKLEPYYLEFHNLRMPVGLYSSTICSCDIGDNVAINNVNYMAHYIIDDECIIVSVNELSTSPFSKFGNGILKEDEQEDLRIWLEVRNENAGRKILPFQGMLPGDAFLWSKYRDDKELLDRFIGFTENKFTKRRGYYGIIGKRCVIKYSKTIKDVIIGDDAYIKGANKLKNLTIKSSSQEKTQIGEGCELVNGIIGYGCRIFYGVKAVRFVMDTNANLKYGARLINSYLGSNATISCCEVLNSLIFPAHEQHHNNSFLCAAVLMGQSNLAAGCTIGSNHNSRGADGEIIAGRGFWPGLSVSLKHNSKFASYTLISKGDYPSEINLEIPFCLLINDVSKNRLVVMPAFWFMYNMYAIARNSWKLIGRDKRIKKIQQLEFDYLAPDTVDEMFFGLRQMEVLVGKNLSRGEKTEEACRLLGKKILMEEPEKLEGISVFAKGVENSKRNVELVKISSAYSIFKRMIGFYGIRELLIAMDKGIIQELSEVDGNHYARKKWLNIGGQLILEEEVEKLKNDAKSGEITSWKGVHERYEELGNSYETHKMEHGIASLYQIKNLEAIELQTLKELINEFKETSTWILNQIKDSRAKDYTNPFRSMIYQNQEEMDSVLGKFSDDSFIREAVLQAENYDRLAGRISSKCF